MSPGYALTMALRVRRPRRTVRLRLTLWYGGLFLVSGAALLAVTYVLVVRAFVGPTAGNALCQAPGADAMRWARSRRRPWPWRRTAPSCTSS